MGYRDTSFSHAGYEKQFHLGVVNKLKSELVFKIFYKLFDVIHADTKELKEEAHRIRYEVFCLENQGYENADQHPNGLEYDDYDVNADHALLIFKPTGKAIGTVRVIKSNANDWRNSFPLQDLCSSSYLHDENYVTNACEFSRLCISAKRRKEVKDTIRGLKGVFNFDRDNPFTAYEKPLINLAMSAAPLGLIRGAFELTMKNKCLNVFGVMERKHIKRLENVGLVYDTIGPEMNYHGKRVPFICNILDIFEHTIVNKYDIWNMVTVQGEAHRQAVEVYNDQWNKQS